MPDPPPVTTAMRSLRSSGIFPPPFRVTSTLAALARPGCQVYRLSLMTLPPCLSGRSPDWLKMKNPDAPAVKREAELGKSEIARPRHPTLQKYPSGCALGHTSAPVVNTTLPSLRWRGHQWHRSVGRLCREFARIRQVAQGKRRPRFDRSDRRLGSGFGRSLF